MDKIIPQDNLEDGVYVFPKLSSGETDKIIKKVNEIVDWINSKDSFHGVAN